MTREEFFAKFELCAGAPGAVPKLRELVLRLAFTGGFSGCHAKELSEGTNWVAKTIDSICSSITPGFACSRSHQVEDGHVHLRTHNISTLGTLNLDLLVRIDPRQVDAAKSSIRRGDILFNNTNSQELVGKTALVDRDHDYSFSNHITRLRLKEDVDPAFVVFYLTLLRNSGHFASLCTRWINQAAINASTLKRQLIPLPPFAEQKRIVAKVDELMALCDLLEAQQKERETRHAALARASLARFADAPKLDNLTFLFHKSYNISPADLRKSILTLAVQGKLVPQDPNDEHADEFLAAIRQRDIDSQSSKPDEADLIRSFVLPTGWAWSRFPELGEFGRGRSKHRPRNDKVLFHGGKYRFVQTGDVARANGEIRTYTDLYNDVGLAQSRMWPAGTLCITIAANIADSGILGFDACFPDSVVGFIPAKPVPSVRYFEYFIRTAKQHLEQFAPSTAQKNINLTILEKVWIPIPPLPEQRRIVTRVDQLMALVDELETQLAASRATGAKLLDAIVAELTA